MYLISNKSPYSGHRVDFEGESQTTHFQFYRPCNWVNQSSYKECQFKPNVTGFFPDWSSPPDLSHRWNNDADRDQTRTQCSEPGGKFAGRVPCLIIVRTEIVPPENEVFDNDDSTEHRCPVSQKTEEVGQGGVESMGSNQRQRNNAKGGGGQSTTGNLLVI